MRIILTFILFPIIFCSNLSANEIDLNDPYYKLGWKNLENPTSKTIEIPDANATIEIVESEIYLDEKFDIKSYEEYMNDEVLSIDDISENLIIADNEGYYTIEVDIEMKVIFLQIGLKFTSADLIETFGKRDFDSSLNFHGHLNLNFLKIKSLYMELKQILTMDLLFIFTVQKY